ncbi:MAG: recombination protein RecR, recombination protein RecR [Microgenomates group bacterium GW2011_GWC1_37_8]|uniref:Recombination protein RecR n=1 Tax=Candidatus Woesebacteria bacterium GW2011_GWB1_38_8 TaxID=1618570 RepID=A0A0G0L1S3_9BACT|nr:MAG: recombination protein RecR, recombination protein RecR [Microgenomates group bacterium GW2011_GWC1_37_8]KKQ84947.1 MAG: Recombination protein RecR [Candidatus Woesebacteria bacterium GW2011_GWB1_38_8]
MKIPRPLSRLIDAFQKLPGIGPKTAQRLTYYLLHVPQVELDEFSESLEKLKKETVLCSICRNVSESDPCTICADIHREKNTIMIVEQPLDILAFERTGKYSGVYHVLHGSLNPLDNIGPDEIFIEDLIKRVKDSNGNPPKEIIIATNPTMEGDATAMYINNKLKINNQKLIITRLGMGIPTGADLEYADETTLREAIEGRRVI